MLRTHTGRTATDIELTEARQHVAEFYLDLARSVRDGEMSFAPHVTEADKKIEEQRYANTASRVLNGDHDTEFWCWQKMNEFITGECIAFLP